MRWVPVCGVTASVLGLLDTARAQDPDPSFSYGARARVVEISSDPSQPTEAETEALQENLGASFSFAESMPGSLPVFSGVPYLIVRGATPSGTATYYDGLNIPSLFHIALGPSVVHPRLLGKLTFYPGVGPARYGGHIGASLVADGARLVRDPRPVRELELTLLDASGFLYLPEANTALAWRVGDPGLLMNLFGLDATLNYFDYQLRHESSIGRGTRLTVLGLGVSDNLGDRTQPEDDIGLMFHRWAVRITHDAPDGMQLGSQLVLGYDTSSLGQELDGEGLRFQPSVYVQRTTAATRLRVGADMLGTLVSLKRRSSDPRRASLFERSQGLSLNPEDFLEGQPFASVPTRNALALYTELHLEPLEHVAVDLGVRGELWLAGSEAELAVSPSARLRYALTPELALHADIGLAHQPHGSPVPLPSLSDVAIDTGLERAVQGEIGVEWQLTPDLQLESSFFYHRYLDVVYLELILDCEGNTNTQAAQAILLNQDLASICRQPGLPTASGEAHGFELYLKRNLTERISGFVSYTLSFGSATARDGTDFTPQSDVRHIMNAVLRLVLGGGFALGLRAHYRSGKIAVNTVYDSLRGHFERLESRLPGFFRADLRGSYSWKVSFGRMEASIGVQNITASTEATHRDCVIDPNGDETELHLPISCRVDYQPAILLPNVGIRAEM